MQPYAKHHAVIFGTLPTVYALTPNIKAAPTVLVGITVQKDCVELSYFIEKKDWLCDFSYRASRFVRQDFLWEQNCLECFVAHADGYLEMNVSFDGAYNLYYFDGYRTPNVMPPVCDTKATLALKYSHLDNFLVRHISLQLNDARTPTQINPTVILYQHKQPIYYAVHHATPPDFHNQRYWIDV